VVGNLGKIYRTNDAGIHWRPLISPTSTILYCVNAADTSNVWVCGYFGTILKSTNEGGITYLNNITNVSVPDKYFLHQNFPNPFNPVTTIRFEIPHSEIEGKITTLKIFDILGKEIATLVNENLKPGTYEVTFDGSNLASGIYFYTLFSDNFMQSKKMLLIK
jgi:hypothetical protein